MLAFEYPFLRMTDVGARQNNSHILSRANFAPCHVEGVIISCRNSGIEIVTNLAIARSRFCEFILG